MRHPRRESRPSVSHPHVHEDRHQGSSKSPRVQRNRTPAPSQPPQPASMGMSPASRYDHNLKVLRRRDPSIISIFDQFSHVCVYHHNGMKWEKQGFEGSMFLYERDSYPPYGFYILNRMGMEDFIHRLFPEDDIHAHGSYLMIRSYPDFTAERIRAIQSLHDPLPEKFSGVYTVPNLDKLGHNDKGQSQTVGLWMFATDAREPMIDVMLRLHSYIKKNLPYPDEFRYGPGRPPPPNPHPNQSTASSKNNRADTSPSLSTNGNQSYESASESESITFSEVGRNAPGDGLSDLDKLFMKLQSTPASSSANAVSPQSSAAIPTVLPSNSQMSVDSWFAALTGAEPTQPSTQTLTLTQVTTEDPTLQPPSSTFSSTNGTTLLNSIFASATPIHTNTNNVVTSIYSPTPTTSSAPSVLSQDVLSNLLGLPPSRSASVVSASSTYSSNAPSLLSAFSHPSSREGDDEDDGGNDDAESLITSASDRGRRNRSRPNGSGVYSSDGAYSESSTVLDTEAELEHPISGTGPRRPSLAQAAESLLRTSGQTVNGRQAHDHGVINGDATPRPPSFMQTHSSMLRMSSVSKLQGASRMHRCERGGDGRSSVPPPPPPAAAAPSVELSLSTSTVRGSHSNIHQRHSNGSLSNNDSTAGGANGFRHRPLVPFSADSELWPYPPPLPGSSSEFDADANESDDDGDIIELDFEETSALSDMNAFKKAQKKGKEKKLSSRNGPVNSAMSAGGSAGSGVESSLGPLTTNGKAKGRKKTRKEKEAEKREQIENSWDAPAPVPNPLPSVPLGLNDNANHARSPTPKKASSATPVVNGNQQHQQVRKEMVKVNNGSSGSSGCNSGAGAVVDPGLVKDSLISTLLGQPQRPGKLERTAFVREVLTLIHNDQSFVDTLWKEYMDKCYTE
ncbi:hypothetical protein JOM56_012056 [Amanita muscaria]